MGHQQPRYGLTWSTDERSVEAVREELLQYLCGVGSDGEGQTLDLPELGNSVESELIDAAAVIMHA